jgi:hypothetical protein
LYGSASNSTIILVTRSGDSFEDGTFSTIMSNAYQTVNLYAGLPGKWLNVGTTGGEFNFRCRTAKFRRSFMAKTKRE